MLTSSTAGSPFFTDCSSLSSPLSTISSTSPPCRLRSFWIPWRTSLSSCHSCRSFALVGASGFCPREAVDRIVASSSAGRASACSRLSVSSRASDLSFLS